MAQPCEKKVMHTVSFTAARTKLTVGLLISYTVNQTMIVLLAEISSLFLQSHGSTITLIRITGNLRVSGFS